jgi:hypothetical protein
MQTRRPPHGHREVTGRASAARLLALLLCLPLLGFVAIVAAEAVPDGRIADRLVDAERAGLIGPSDPGPTPLGTTAALYTECTAFSLGLGDAADGVVAGAVLGTAYTGCERLRTALAEYRTSGELRDGFSYLRYWHGYGVITRPSLAVTGVEGTRWIAFAFLALAVGGMCAAVWRAFGAVTGLLLAAPTMLTTDVVIGSLSTSSAIGTGTAWLAGWLSFALVTRRVQWRIAALAAALAGALTAYLDLMTTMPGSFALTVVGATLGATAAGLPPTLPGMWRLTAAAAAGWGIGLSSMWVSKWVFASFVVGLDEVVDNVGSQIGFRLSSDGGGVSDSRVRGLTSTLEEWWSQPLTSWVVFATIVALGAVAIRGRRGSAGVGRIALCCAVAAIPVAAWYLVLNNHSQIHPRLVYRSLPIAFGAVAALADAALAGRVGAPAIAPVEAADGRPGDDARSEGRSDDDSEEIL